MPLVALCILAFRREWPSRLWPRNRLSAVRKSHQAERLFEAAGKGNRWRVRNQMMILLAYRLGLPGIRRLQSCREQIEFGAGRLHVRRRKNGRNSVHPQDGREQRILREGQREVAEQCPDSGFLFLSERGGPMSETGFLKMCSDSALTPIPFPSTRTCHDTHAAIGWQMPGNDS